MVKRAFGPDFRQEGHYSIPSYSLNRADFDHAKYWRGPVWLSTNWLLIEGLRRYEMDDLIDVVIEDSLGLINRFGFYEYFDPRKSIEANGYGTDAFSWSAALYLDLLHSLEA